MAYSEVFVLWSLGANKEYELSVWLVFAKNVVTSLAVLTVGFLTVW